MNLKSTKSIDEHSSNTRLASPWGHLIILAKTSGEEKDTVQHKNNEF